MKEARRAVLVLLLLVPLLPLDHCKIDRYSLPSTPVFLLPLQILARKPEALLSYGMNVVLFLLVSNRPGRADAAGEILQRRP
ncbi:hypothetical protein B296_00056342 [Ensete ventricosum]|uniref:Uncharacterized protein n=1 Tax=Ensete ventricosum TaxID=4639 RepID=A0A426X405_ENSVE|nr:hypothetical protein B296_00056342 [Ensete ventricosum]